MRNCQRCRPCKPCGGNKGGGCVETIVEPTVHCVVPERHHHRRIRHIVPIVYHQAHHHHKHHEYEVKRKFTHEHKHHEHGRFDGDWCEVDKRRSQCGDSKTATNNDFDNFDNGFDNDCSSEMYM